MDPTAPIADASGPAAESPVGATDSSASDTETHTTAPEPSAEALPTAADATDSHASPTESPSAPTADSNPDSGTGGRRRRSTAARGKAKAASRSRSRAPRAARRKATEPEPAATAQAAREAVAQSAPEADGRPPSATAPASPEPPRPVSEPPSSVPEPPRELRERSSGSPPPFPGVDLDDAVRRLGLPASTIIPMLHQFRRSQSETIAQLRTAIRSRDKEAIRRLAHSLAGAAGNLSINELRRLARTIELAVKFDQGDLDAMLAETEAEAARVFAGIDAAKALPVDGAAVRAPGGAAAPGHRGDAIPRLEALARALDDGDPDAIQEAWHSVRAIAFPSGAEEGLHAIDALVTGFEFREAARLARELIGSLAE